ncbi:MAG: hypothetical protein PHI98_11940 [Eubacteriales bacterium]|nr:hypothetical protein [Eubacteriales bacterium]
MLKRMIACLLAFSLFGCCALAEQGVTAADDFYAFANAALIESHPPVESTDTSVGALEVEGWSYINQAMIKISNDEEAHLRALICDPSSAQELPTEQILATASRLMQDHTARNAQGVQPILGYIDRIAAATSVDALMLECAHIYAETGVPIFFMLSASGDTETEEYTPKLTDAMLNMYEMLGDSYEAHRDEYKTLLTQIYALLGFDQNEAALHAENAMTCDELIYQAESYNGDDITELSEADSLLPALRLTDCYSILGLDGVTSIHPDSVYSSLYAIGTLATNEHLAMLQSSAMLAFFEMIGPYLSDEATLLQALFLSPANDEQPTHVPCIATGMNADDLYELLSTMLAIEISDNYSERYVSAETIDEIKAEMENVFNWYRAQIDARPWMSEATKAKALKKLDNCLVFVGHSSVSPYHDAEADNLVDFVLSGKKARLAYETAMVTDPEFHRVAWPVDMKSDIVNAGYSPYTNTIRICAGILQEPFYGADATQNAGGILFVLAHECAHAFDPKGCQYDAFGRHTNDWDTADIAAYTALTDQVVGFYDRFPYEGDQVRDANITLQEDTADLAAMQYTMSVLSTDDEKRTALLTFAHCWYAAHSEAYYNKMGLNSHAFSRTRINAAVSSVEDFYRIYNVNEGDAMYVAPEDRPNIWR